VRYEWARESPSTSDTIEGQAQGQYFSRMSVDSGLQVPDKIDWQSANTTI